MTTVCLGAYNNGVTLSRVKYVYLGNVKFHIVFDAAHARTYAIECCINCIVLGTVGGAKRDMKQDLTVPLMP